MSRSKETDAASAKPSRKPRTQKKPPPSATPELRLTGDRLIVRVPENGERKTSGGLLIPATAMPAPKHLQWGEVTLVGPDVRVAEAGDRVLFLPSSGLEVELDGEELVLLRERDVQAVSSEPADARRDRTPGQYL
ncbi:MAG: GroES family chaperonin [Planctomycetaceae bacterium]